jgi:hypothetical protein
VIAEVMPFEPDSKVVLTIPDSVPSLNVLLGMHWGKRMKLRSRWHWLVREARLAVRARPQKLEHATITIERWGPRKIDFDNMVGSGKILVDLLVREGFLIDDSPDHVRVRYLQSIGPPKTTITIEP